MKSLYIIVSVIIVIIIGFLTINSKSGSQESRTKFQTNSSESGLKQKSSSLHIGSAFPEFTVTEVSSKTITRDSLKGKPAIIWFTTSWCVPCQIGAQEVSAIDNELGGDTFNVLVIFVDLNEKPEDLINWRKEFANEDWMVAFDNELTKLAAKVNLKSLDSKFLLDKNGVIQNIDFQVANDEYLNEIKKVVNEN